jgi:hypothetical protein
MSDTKTASAKRVTSDWAKRFDGFDAWRTLRLARRIGPVVQGITLDRSTAGDAYFPTAHIHALTRKFPVVSLTLSQRLRAASGVQESIRFAEHQALFQGAAERLASQSWLSLFGPPSIVDIVASLRSFATSQQERGYPPAVIEVEDCVLIAAASGDDALADECLDFASTIAEQWSPRRMPLDWEGVSQWTDQLRARVGNRSELMQLVAEQIAFHKLDSVRTAV